MESGYKLLSGNDFQIIGKELVKEYVEGNGWGIGNGAIIPSLKIREGFN